MFWLSLGKIAWIDILLSGDNALVIAMVCRGLPPKQRLWGMVLGALGAVMLRVTLTGIVSEILNVPYLKMIGGVALYAIAVKLIWSSGDDEADVKEATSLWNAIGIVAVADITMSIDNVIAVAAAANGDILLLALGLAMSIPLIVAGASIIVQFLNRFPILIWAGATLLGWIAGDVVSTDPIFGKPDEAITLGMSIWFAVSVLITGGIRRIVHGFA